MLKVMVVITRKDDMSREEFLAHWREGHPEFVRRLPGVRRYSQNVAIDHRKAWPADGIAELWFDSLKDIAVAFDSPAAVELFAHEEEFIGDARWFIAEEFEIPLSAGAVGEVA